MKCRLGLHRWLRRHWHEEGLSGYVCKNCPKTIRWRVVEGHAYIVD